MAFQETGLTFLECCKNHCVLEIQDEQENKEAKIRDSDEMMKLEGWFM